MLPPESFEAPRWPPALRGIRAAAIFLTRIPFGGFPFTPHEWRWAPAHFPLIGLGLGLIQALLFASMAQRVGAFVAAVVVVIASLMLTGAFHEDGLADTADALGGAFDREKLFVILKDSRIGTFGGSALVLGLLLRVALLTRLGEGAPVALVVVECASRLPPIWLMRVLPYVTNDAASRSRLVARAQSPQVLVATLWALFAVGAALALDHIAPAEALLMLVVSALVAAFCGYRFHVRAGGLTGDFLGATQQLVCGALLFVLAYWRGP